MAGNDYWLKQDPSHPLFPDLIWSKPENKRTAGKLLIVGGSRQSFAAAATAYNEALSNGTGSVRIVLPDSIKKTVNKVFPEADFLPSNPSGGFGQAGLSELLELAEWADGTLIVGNLGHNSETAVLIEKFINQATSVLTATDDIVGLFATMPAALLQRSDCCLVLSISTLQKIATNIHFPRAMTHTMGLLQLVDWLHEFCQTRPANIITLHSNYLVIASQDRVSSTPVASAKPAWQNVVAVAACVWMLQNPDKYFEALNCSVVTS